MSKIGYGSALPPAMPRSKRLGGQQFETQACCGESEVRSLGFYSLLKIDSASNRPY